MKKMQLCLCADGRISIRVRGKIDKNFPNALPVYSVDTEKDAKSLQVLLGKLQRFDDGNFYYTLPNFKGTIDALFEAEKLFEKIEKTLDK